MRTHQRQQRQPPSIGGYTLYPLMEEEPCDRCRSPFVGDCWYAESKDRTYLLCPRCALVLGKWLRHEDQGLVA